MSPTDPDVVVIGSGFGGSISANRLAEAGLGVLVLERGPWRDSLPVRSMGIAQRAPFPYGMKALTHILRTVHLRRWDLTFNRGGMFELFSFPGLGVLVVSAVGGGSHGWAGMLAEPQDPAYWRDRHPALNPQDVERYYAKVVDDMGAVRLSRDHALKHSVWTQLPESNAGRCRPADPQPYMAVQLPRSEAEAGRVIEQDGVKRQICAFDGDSLLGSKGGAKSSVDFVYLAPALKRGAVVRDMCEATSISRDQGSGEPAGYAIQFTALRGGKKQQVRTKRVILAAGTMNTLRLLFVSSGLNPMSCLGKTFGGNGDLFGAWFKQSAEPPLFQSAPVLGCFKVDDQDVPFIGLAGLPGIDTLPLPPVLKRKLAKTVPMIGMGADDGNDSVSFEHGRLKVHYDPTRHPIFEKIRAAIRALEADSGLRTWAIKKPITIHPWGGARLGDGPDSGVIDHHGEVYGNPGLFIADGAALPAACGTPPSLAIAAWAHHVADGLVQRTR